jgi:excisionase family DNA binding protein
LEIPAAPAGRPAPSKEDSIGDKVTTLDPIFEKFLTVEELAGALGIAPKTVRNWVALRRIPFLRLGGKTRFRRRSIEAWLERKEFNPCP